MLNADRAVRMSGCPRCGAGGFESLRSHSYCVECNYAEIPTSEEMLAIPKWVFELLKTPKKNVNKSECDNHPGERLLALA